MLTRDERTLLENVLDALDRLFDGDSTVTEIHALLLATATALRATEHASSFDSPIRQLRDLLKSGEVPDRKRELALNATDELRACVSQELRHDAVENPKRRHVTRRGVVTYGGFNPPPLGEEPDPTANAE